MLHFNALRVGNGSEIHFFIVFHQKLRILVELFQLPGSEFKALRCRCCTETRGIDHACCLPCCSR